MRAFESNEFLRESIKLLFESGAFLRGGLELVAEHLNVLSSQAISRNWRRELIAGGLWGRRLKGALCKQVLDACLRRVAAIVGTRRHIAREELQGADVDSGQYEPIWT